MRVKMKLGIVRMENNGNVTYLSQSQMMFMRINPITMKVERLNLDNWILFSMWWNWLFWMQQYWDVRENY